MQPWQDMFGVPADADVANALRAMTRLVLSYHPDTGGTQGPDDPHQRSV